MNKSTWLIVGAILLGALLIGGAVLFAANQMSFKIATVNLNKLIQDSELGQKLGQELNNKKTEIEGKIASAKTNEEKEKLTKEFEQFQSTKDDEFTKKAKKAISNVCKKKGIKAVASSSMFVHNELDITDDVIKELDK